MTDRKFRSKASGQQVYVEPGRHSEQLAAALNSRLTDEPTEEERQEEEVEKARERVDASPQWASMPPLLVEAAADGNRLADQLDQEAYARYPDAFETFKVDAREKFAARQLARNTEFRSLIQSVRAAWPIPAIPFPVTSVDTNALAIRLGQLDTASPPQAKVQVEDGLRRGDIPYLTAAGQNLASWMDYRNSWLGKEAQRIANDLIERIENATRTAERDAADYCQKRCDASVFTWTYVMNRITNEIRFDLKSEQANDSLSPLLNPIPAKKAAKASITFDGDNIIVNDATDAE